MKIEKRDGEEWLVNAPDELSDCLRRAVPDDEDTTCCYHLNGEHIAVNGMRRILARWPIEPASPVEAPAQPAPRFLTPDEVRVAQVAHVAKEIERINAELAPGVRSFAVNVPLFEDIKPALQAAGWSVNGVMTANGRTSFVVRERKGVEG